MRAVDRVSLTVMPKSRPGEHYGFTSALCGNSEQPQIPKNLKIFLASVSVLRASLSTRLRGSSQLNAFSCSVGFGISSTQFHFWRYFKRCEDPERPPVTAVTQAPARRK
jgi:hypothetical protein